MRLSFGVRKILSIFVSTLTLTLFTSNVFAAGDAENVKKLENLNVKDRKPNALGGIQTMLGE